MKIDLTELLQKVGNEADLEQSQEVSFPDDGLNLTKPARIRFHLVNTGDLVLVNGQVETEAELECSRCLKTYKIPLAVKIDEEFSRQPPELKSGGGIELREEDFVYPIEKDNTIDLTEVLRQNLLLAVPMKTLCSPDCQGIAKAQKKGEK